MVKDYCYTMHAGNVAVLHKGYTDTVDKYPVFLYCTGKTWHCCDRRSGLSIAQRDTRKGALDAARGMVDVMKEKFTSSWYTEALRVFRGAEKITEEQLEARK